MNLNWKEMFVWIFGILCIAALLFSPVACTMRKQQLISDAIEKGHDPIAVRCALEDSFREGICLLKASQTNQVKAEAK